DHRRRADRPQDLGHELLRLEPGELLRELEHEDVVRARFLDQLDATRKRRQKLDVVAKDESRVGVERDHRGAETGLLRGLDRGPMPPVHAIEGADRHCAVGRLELGRRAHDAHTGSSSGSSISFGTGEGTSHRTPRTPAAAANQRVGRRPKAAPSAPPASAPRGRTPKLTKRRAPVDRERSRCGVSAVMIALALMSRIMTPSPERNSAVKSMARTTGLAPPASGTSRSGAGKSTIPKTKIGPIPKRRLIRPAIAAPRRLPIAPAPRTMPSVPERTCSSRVA